MELAAVRRQIEPGLRLDQMTLENLIGTFESLSKAEGIFEPMQAVLADLNVGAAEVVASAWYGFSAFMPLYLCAAATFMRDNLRRHYIVRVAYEELGERVADEIHADLFLRACDTVGLEANKLKLNSAKTASVLGSLMKSLRTAPSDSFILGMNMGLEIIAYENIETLYSAVAYEPAFRRNLRDSVFFKTHFVNEEEHIRLTVSNFMRFCTTQDEQNDFVDGFYAGLAFWKEYWAVVAKAAQEKTA